AGDGQTGEVGAALPDSLAVVARDDFDNPVPEVIVRWRAASGELSDAEVPTGADGRAAVQWTLGSTPGVQRASAEAAGLDGSPLDGSPVEFRATARLGPSPRLSIVTQPASSAVSGARLGRQPVVRIVTAAGAPVSQPDVAVTAAIASGGGGLGGTTTRTTDAQGVATFTDLAITGPPGPRTLIFAAPGFTAATSAEVQLLAPVPSSMAAVAGQGQTAAAGSAVATAPAVIVRDQTGAPLGGVTVTFTVTAGGGQLTGATPTTDAGGVARVGSWVLGTTAGNNRLEASVAAAGVSGNPITFTATGVPGPPSPAASVATVPDGRIFAWTTIVVTAYDQFGNRITGGGAAVAITVSGANNPGPLQVSDGGDGTYSASYLPVFTGTDQVTIVLNGVPLSGSPFASRVRLF
ncbi:MAG TPA: filamin/ABP280 repeat domain-containing protein, partial [Gemmatimonadales bacterium]|nr:filamin/ABP280 repeat domain-containing protein [Gemmatimonadales bacterium]